MAEHLDFRDGMGIHQVAGHTVELAGAVVAEDEGVLSHRSGDGLPDTVAQTHVSDEQAGCETMVVPSGDGWFGLAYLMIR